MNFKNPFTQKIIKLSIAATIIGLLKNFQFLLMIILLIRTIYNIHRVKNKDRDTNFRLYIIGVVLTTTVGISAELWGTYYHFWDYHNLNDKQLIPLWLPCAWACVYHFLYETEKLISLTYQLSKRQHLYTLLIVSLIIPTYGEIIAINLNVWTYNWPYQFLGVPVYAMLLLMMLHTSIFMTLSRLAHYTKP